MISARTPLQLHLANWNNCTRCSYHKTRNRVVIGRGKLPCDILIIGEAPGDAEDVNGQPFIGEAGRLLDEIIAKAVPEQFKFAMTNIVGCLPCDEEGRKDGEPELDSIKACSPRVQEFFALAKPKLLVCVGKVATTWLDQGFQGSIQLPEVPTISIIHPAAILRANFAQRSLLCQRAVVTLSVAIEKYLLKEESPFSF